MFEMVIFDLDGVITDTARFHYLAWKKLAGEMGIDFDKEFNEKLKGVSRIDSLELILKSQSLSDRYSQEEKLEMSDKKNNYYRNLIEDMNQKDILPGIEVLLLWLRNEEIGISLGSASKNAPAILKKLGIEKYIDYIVDPAMVQEGKPAPDIFLKAAEHFSIEPQNCIVVEDALSGVIAGKSVSMYVIGVGDERILSDADKVVPSTSLLLDIFKKLKKNNLLMNRRGF